MERLTNTQLENIIGEKINRREIIDDSKLGRIIEKVEFINRDVLIKYGWDEGLRKELSIYEKVLYNSENYPVPQLLKSKKINGIYFLAIEWIDGIHPDFRKKNHIEEVFTALGKWAAEWSEQIENNRLMKRNSLSNFEVLNELLEKNQNSLTQILGNSLMDLLMNCLSQSGRIIRNIEKTPLTLTPGDISLQNFIINTDEEVIFIDFESCTVSPMIMLVEHLGEDYESIPHSKSDIRYALTSYLNSWNRDSNKHFEWDEFMRCQHSARVYYKIGDFNYWINRILEDNNLEETLEWIKSGHEQLEILMKSPDFRL